MQFKLLVTLVVIGGCIFQASSAPNAVDEINRGLIDALIEKAKEAVKKLIDYVEKKVDEVFAYFNEMKDKVTDFANEALDSFKKKLDELIASASQEIDEIKQKAEELGIDISNCISKSEDQFKQLFSRFLDNEIMCVEDEVDKAMKIINDSINIIQTHLNEVLELPSKIKNCGTGFSCLKDVLWETAKLEASLPAEIAKKVSEVTGFVSSVSTRLELCASNQLINAGVEASSIVIEVAKCAADQDPKFLLLF